MTQNEEILNKLCNGEISIEDASRILKLTNKEIERLLDDFIWIPSSEKLVEFCDQEKELISKFMSLSEQNSIISTAQYRMSYVTPKLSFEEPITFFSPTIRSTPQIPSAISSYNLNTSGGRDYSLEAYEQPYFQ